jgi:hypothetical protein
VNNRHKTEAIAYSLLRLIEVSALDEDLEPLLGLAEEARWELACAVADQSCEPMRPPPRLPQTYIHYDAQLQRWRRIASEFGFQLLEPAPEDAISLCLELVHCPELLAAAEAQYTNLKGNQ